jgi:hypothetical protein
LNDEEGNPVSAKIKIDLAKRLAEGRAVAIDLSSAGVEYACQHSLSCNRQFPPPVALLKTAPKMSGDGRPDSYQLLKE